MLQASPDEKPASSMEWPTAGYPNTPITISVPGKITGSCAAGILMSSLLPRLPQRSVRLPDCTAFHNFSEGMPQIFPFPQETPTVRIRFRSSCSAKSLKSQRKIHTRFLHSTPQSSLQASTYVLSLWQWPFVQATLIPLPVGNRLSSFLPPRQQK